MRGALDRARQRLVPKLKAAGYAGVRARVQLAISEAWGRRLAMELDRGTPHHDIAAAFGEALPDLLAGVVLSLYADERTPEQMSEIAHDLIKTAWARTIQDLMNYDRGDPLERIAYQDAGAGHA